MTMKFHYDPEILSLTMDIRGPPKSVWSAVHANMTSHTAARWGLTPPYFESYKRPYFEVN